MLSPIALPLQVPAQSSRAEPPHSPEQSNSLAQLRGSPISEQLHNPIIIKPRIMDERYFTEVILNEKDSWMQVRIDMLKD